MDTQEAIQNMREGKSCTACDAPFHTTYRIENGELLVYIEKQGGWTHSILMHVEDLHEFFEGDVVEWEVATIDSKARVK